MSVTNLSTRALMAGHAQVAWRLRRAGFYVFNERTGIVVAGPFDSERVAQHEARDRNGEAPRARDLLAVKPMDGEG